MSRFIATAFLALSLIGAGAAEAQQVLKIGYLDSAAILRETPGAAEAQQQFQQDMVQIQTSVQSEAERMRAELDQMISEYEAQQAMMSDEARRQRESQIGQKQAEFAQQLQQLNAQAEAQAGQRQAELVQPIMDRINAVVDQIRREGNYSVIFDLAAGAILAADPALDLTGEVIRRLRAQTEGGQPDADR